MPQLKFNGVPAQEAIEHLRQKARIPTRRWTDLMGAANAHAFTVAGATELELLKDLHTSVLAAIENGEGISQFRKRFDEVVQLHGWQYKGKRGWRTRVIYDNNLRTAQMAGRWQQIQRTKKTRPYLVYVTVNDERVRDSHHPWHHLVLPVDDRFWDTHYPPNGWGCRCTIRTANEKQLARQELEISERPALKKESRISTRTGEDFGKVPVGIDTGWDYNPGKAWLGPDIALGNKLSQLPASLQNAAWQSINTNERQNARLSSWQNWLSERAKEGQPKGHLFNVGHLSPQLLKTLNNEFPKLAGKAGRGNVQNTAIVVADKQINHLTGSHKNESKRFPPEWLKQLPKYLQNYSAVLLQKSGSKSNILLVLPKSIGDKKGRIVVEINTINKGQIYNSIRSLGVVSERNLKGEQYDLLEGEI